MKRAKQINSDADPGGAIVGALRNRGWSNDELWGYALIEVRDRGSYAAVRWLIQAGYNCPQDLRDEFVDAIERVGEYRPKDRHPPKLNNLDRELVRIDWVRFCAEWIGRHPRTNPPVDKWIEIFRQKLSTTVVSMGKPMLTDAELRRIAPRSTLRLMIADTNPYKRSRV